VGQPRVWRSPSPYVDDAALFQTLMSTVASSREPGAQPRGTASGSARSMSTMVGTWPVAPGPRRSYVRAIPARPPGQGRLPPLDPRASALRYPAGPGHQRGPKPVEREQARVHSCATVIRGRRSAYSVFSAAIAPQQRRPEPYSALRAPTRAVRDRLRFVFFLVSATTSWPGGAWLAINYDRRLARDYLIEIDSSLRAVLQVSRYSCSRPIRRDHGTPTAVAGRMKPAPPHYADRGNVLSRVPGWPRRPGIDRSRLPQRRHRCVTSAPTPTQVEAAWAGT